MAVWREILEAEDNNLVGFCPVDLFSNFGVPISWFVNTDDDAKQEDVTDVTP